MFLITSKFKRLSSILKNKSGRSTFGNRILKSKTSILKKIRSIQINYSFRSKRLGTVAGFNLIPVKNKLVSLIFFSNGTVSYFLTTNTHNLFSFFFSNTVKKLKKIKILSSYFLIFQIKKLTHVSCLEISPGKGAQYVRSSGTKSRLFRFDKTNHSCLAEMPSGVKKLFSYYSFCQISPVSLSMHKKTSNGRAGFWRSFGFKPRVRGVAMNAVDHPHGGRTKSIKYPRTPWGKTTKKK